MRKSAAISSAVRPLRSARRRSVIAAPCPVLGSHGQGVKVLPWQTEAPCHLRRRSRRGRVCQCQAKRLLDLDWIGRLRGGRRHNNRDLSFEAVARGNLLEEFISGTAHHLLMKLGQFTGDGDTPIAQRRPDRLKGLGNPPRRLEEYQ